MPTKYKTKPTRKRRPTKKTRPSGKMGTMGKGLRGKPRAGSPGTTKRGTQSTPARRRSNVSYRRSY